MRRFGGLLEPAPHVGERCRALPAALAALAPDVIALQEVYERVDQDHLARALSETHPHVVRGAPSTRWRLGAGLLALSRRPCRSRFVPFRDAFVEERLLATKGILVIELDCLTILVTHTSAGGLWRHPEHATCDRVRDRQIEQLCELADRASPPVLVVGDMNTGPGVSDANYRRFAKAGWIDVFARCHPGDAGTITWDPRNLLNADGWHRHCPPQRIDHVFARASELASARLAITGCAVALDAPSVRIGDQQFSVSDHAAVVVDIRT